VVRRTAVGCLLVIAACSSFSSTTPRAAAGDPSDGGAADGEALAEAGDAGPGTGQGDGATVGPCPEGGAHRLMFVTHDVVSANLGGQAGAASVCNAAALDAGLAGSYVAWISLSAAPPGPNLAREQNVPIVLPNCALLANDLDHLETPNGLLHTPNVTERGLEVGNGVCYVWTSTNQSGAPEGSGTCGDWTDTDGGLNGLVGNCTAEADSGEARFWTEFPGGWPCDNVARLYCLQN
jgi:hypothetical protein